MLKWWRPPTPPPLEYSRRARFHFASHVFLAAPATPQPGVGRSAGERVPPPGCARIPLRGRKPIQDTGRHAMGLTLKWISTTWCGRPGVGPPSAKPPGCSAQFATCPAFVVQAQSARTVLIGPCTYRGSYREAGAFSRPRTGLNYCEVLRFRERFARSRSMPGGSYGAQRVTGHARADPRSRG
jgi:hypothetical protein